jgi:hypothetical protein
MVWHLRAPSLNTHNRIEPQAYRGVQRHFLATSQGYEPPFKRVSPQRWLDKRIGVMVSGTLDLKPTICVRMLLYGFGNRMYVTATLYLFMGLYKMYYTASALLYYAILISYRPFLRLSRDFVVLCRCKRNRPAELLAESVRQFTDMCICC